MTKSNILNDDGLDILFRKGRTYHKWQDKDVSDVALQALYDLMKMGPTAMNCLPARVTFIRSSEGKAKLKECLAEGNIEQTMAAPVVAVLAYDKKFHHHLPKLYPHMDGKSYFEGKDDLIIETALRNSSLQGGYFIMAARALGLDCGPMSGFDEAKVNETFFADKNYHVNFICNLGYGDVEGTYPRSPRFDFDDICEIV